MNASDALKKIRKDFAKNEAVKNACENIFADFLKVENKNNLMNMGFNTLKRIALTESKDVVNQAIMYFLGDRVNLLEASYSFFDEDDRWFDLENEVVVDAIRNNIFYHPETEEEILDFPNKIFIKYSISEQGRSYCD